MDWYINFLYYLIFPVVFGLLIPFVKNYQAKVETRFHMLEQDVRTKVSEAQVRQLLDDKINPIRDDIGECKDKLDQIMLYLLENKRDYKPRS